MLDILKLCFRLFLIVPDILYEIRVIFKFVDLSLGREHTKGIILKQVRVLFNSTIAKKMCG